MNEVYNVLIESNQSLIQLLDGNLLYNARSGCPTVTGIRSTNEKHNYILAEGLYYVVIPT